MAIRHSLALKSPARPNARPTHATTASHGKAPCTAVGELSRTCQNERAKLNPCFSGGWGENHGIRWYALACHGMPWYTMVCHGMLWHSMMVFNGLPWFSIPLYTMAYHGKPWYSPVEQDAQASSIAAQIQPKTCQNSWLSRAWSGFLTGTQI